MIERIKPIMGDRNLVTAMGQGAANELPNSGVVFCDKYACHNTTFPPSLMFTWQSKRLRKQSLS